MEVIKFENFGQIMCIRNPNIKYPLAASFPLVMATCTFEGFEEDDDPIFNTLGFVGTPDNDLEENCRLIEDKYN